MSDDQLSQTKTPRMPTFRERLDQEQKNAEAHLAQIATVRARVERLGLLDTDFNYFSTYAFEPV